MPGPDKASRSSFAQRRSLTEGNKENTSLLMVEEDEDEEDEEDEDDEDEEDQDKVEDDDEGVNKNENNGSKRSNLSALSNSDLSQQPKNQRLLSLPNQNSSFLLPSLQEEEEDEDEDDIENEKEEEVHENDETGREIKGREGERNEDIVEENSDEDGSIDDGDDDDDISLISYVDSPVSPQVVGYGVPKQIRVRDPGATGGGARPVGASDFDDDDEGTAHFDFLHEIV